LGRSVTRQELDSALAAIKAVGPPEWSLDLIYGIPGQTWDELMEDLDCAVEAMPPHISMYDLTYTPAYSERVRQRLGDRVAEEALAFAEANYAEACHRLVAAGYRRYEISNFALSGHECRHNQAYWNGADYLGLGASAVSTVGGERLTNPASVDAYLLGESPSVEVLDKRTKLWERAMLGLRTAAGVEEEAVSEVLVPTEVERLVAGGYLERHCGKLRVNAGFLDVSNSLISAVLTGR
jgi:oxygen-independent coproporphyrinogen-3 oxidase